MEIIQATSGHLELAAPLFNAYRESYAQQGDLAAATAFLEERFKNNDTVIFLAIENSPENRDPKGAAFAQLYPSFSSVAMKPIYILNDLFVAPEFRRAGIGRKMLSQVAQFARQRGAARVVLATANDNVPAQTLYKSFGYQLDETFQHYSLPLEVTVNEATS